MSVADGTRSLKVGLILQMMTGADGSVPRWTEMAEMGKLAEDVGFDSLWLTDHLIYHLEGEEKPRGIWEAWSFLSALAAVTERVELGTVVLAMGWRNPALLAKMCDAVEEISGGRLILGLGAGYHKLEFDAFGFPYDYRISRFEEAIQIVSGLLRDGAIDFDGKYHFARDCELNPRGPRPNGPPIMLGTNNGSPRMQGIAARYADMWNIFFDITSNKVQGFIDVKPEFDKACRDQGRDLATFGATVSVMVADSSADPWWDRLPVGDVPPILPLLSADPERVAEDLAAYEAAGASHVQISLDPTTPAAIEALARALEALDRLSK